MKIQTSTKSHKNFEHMVDNIIGGFKYSIGVGNSSYIISLDEEQIATFTASGVVVRAENVVNLIGLVIFRKLIENVAMANICYLDATNTTTVSGLLDRAFSWDSTSEGDAFWDEVHKKLREGGM